MEAGACRKDQWLFFYLRFVRVKTTLITIRSGSKTLSNWNLLSQLTILDRGPWNTPPDSSRLNNNFHTFSCYYESARATEWSVMRPGGGRGGGLGRQGSEFLAMVLYIIIFRLLRLILGGLTCKLFYLILINVCLGEVSSFKYYFCTDIGYPMKNFIPKTTWNWK